MFLCFLVGFIVMDSWSWLRTMVLGGRGVRGSLVWVDCGVYREVEKARERRDYRIDELEQKHVLLPLLKREKAELLESQVVLNNLNLDRQDGKFRLKGRALPWRMERLPLQIKGECENNTDSRITCPGVQRWFKLGGLGLHTYIVKW